MAPENPGVGCAGYSEMKTHTFRKCASHRNPGKYTTTLQLGNTTRMFANCQTHFCFRTTSRGREAIIPGKEARDFLGARGLETVQDGTHDLAAQDGTGLPAKSVSLCVRFGRVKLGWVRSSRVVSGRIGSDRGFHRIGPDRAN